MFGKNSSLRTFISLLVVVVCFQTALAHQPDLSSLMIYEQNGKSILLIKSSLTAFEGEVDYIFGKNSYKTPQEFQELLVKHFQKNCFVVINKDTIKFVNHQVILGHETSLFAELSNRPQTMESLYIKNTIFKDIPNNLCEVILSIKDLPQKQLLLGDDLQHEATLQVENGSWTIKDTRDHFYQYPIFMLTGGLLILAIIALIIILLKRKKNRRLFFYDLR